MGQYNPEAEPKQEQDVASLQKAGVSMAWRDTCGHLLVKLNACRRETTWSPSECGHERHTYEECQYYAYLQRVEAKKQQTRLAAEQQE